MKRIGDHIIGCDGNCASPGKYEGNDPQCLAERIHEISLDGCDEELGSVSETGIWLGLLTDLTGAGRYHAAIVEENDQGFVSVNPFETNERARAEWDKLIPEEYETA